MHTYMYKCRPINIHTLTFGTGKQIFMAMHIEAGMIRHTHRHMKRLIQVQAHSHTCMRSHTAPNKRLLDCSWEDCLIITPYSHLLPFQLQCSQDKHSSGSIDLAKISQACKGNSSGLSAGKLPFSTSLDEVWTLLSQCTNKLTSIKTT